MLGQWKDFQDLEDSLSLPELNAILIEGRRRIDDERTFLAALQGVDLNAGQTEEAFKSVQENVKRRLEEKTGTKLADPALSGFIGDELDYEEVIEVG